MPQRKVDGNTHNILHLTSNVKWPGLIVNARNAICMRYMSKRVREREIEYRRQRKRQKEG